MSSVLSQHFVIIPNTKCNSFQFFVLYMLNSIAFTMYQYRTSETYFLSRWILPYIHTIIEFIQKIIYNFKKELLFISANRDSLSSRDIISILFFRLWIFVRFAIIILIKGIKRLPRHMFPLHLRTWHQFSGNLRIKSVLYACLRVKYVA